MESIATFTITDIVGYLASIIVLVAFLMKNIRTLRIINSIGCVLFVVYGILLNFSIPIIITNAAIACINGYYLLRTSQK
ncbi:MAG: YgjV family protein [Bacteroidetes bacterium]|nr:YgjV family protein [Bacteroidota bacterium]